MVTKPELLMPAGNVESFYAAIQGGADAVYVGTKQFNARGRAGNFTLRQLQALVKIAHKNEVKVYLTLNTVIKNSELNELPELLNQVFKYGVDAIIIQDWGVYFLLKRFFPELTIHASTQMGNHNSNGTLFSQQKGFERVILARELTLNELESICQKSKIQTEIFIHGALCYSFSGMCLFSSFLGGSGANRGLCAQPCRRNYSEKQSSKFLFNLKDNQQLEHISQFTGWGVTSLKVEGRMKSEDYVFRVAKAYREVIDNNNIEQARSLLELDFGREKTDYFYGNSVKKSISESSATGVKIGKVTKVENGYLFVKSNFELRPGARVRIQTQGTDERLTLKIKEVEKTDGLFKFPFNKNIPKINDIVFLTGLKEQRFPSKLEDFKSKRIAPLDFRSIKEIKKSVRFYPEKGRKDTIFLRIGSPGWLRKIHLAEPDFLILNFSKKGWGEFNYEAPFIQKFREKIIIELPRFIPEKSLDFYSILLRNFGSAGIRNCMVSHLSQKLLMPKGFVVFSNENVYCFNDAAIKHVLSEGVSNVVFPYENDFENLLAGTFRKGIVPVYFYPELFYSRMPVKTSDGFFKNDNDKNFQLLNKDGMTIVIPEHPVSLLQYKSQLKKEGFNNYLVDVSYDNPSKNLVKKLINRLRYSEQVQPSVNFNFKAGLK